MQGLAEELRDRGYPNLLIQSIASDSVCGIIERFPEITGKEFGLLTG
jgi:hypothetical protein